MRLDINAFYILEAIIEQQSFARAAQRLHMTQSAVSYQIKRLEQHLQIAIFDRQGYRAKLTPQGEMLWQEVQQLTSQIDRISHLGKQIAAGWEASLELVIDGAIDLTPVLTSLKQMQDEHIPTRIRLRREFLDGVKQRFMQDKADIMLSIHHHPTSGLTSRALPHAAMLLVASHQHPLATMQHIDEATLLQHTELSIQDSSLNQPNSPLPRSVAAQKQLLLSDFSAKKHAILAGLGFGWMPVSHIQAQLNSGQLVQLPHPGGNHFHLQPSLVYRSNAPLGKAAQRFSELMLATED